MKFLDLKELQERVAGELELNEYNVSEANKRNIPYQHRYLTLKYEEEEKLDELRAVKDRLHDRLYDQYRWRNDKIIKHKDELLGKVTSDPRWRKFMRIYRKQERIVNYLEKVVGLFEKRSFSITNLFKELEREDG